jgi:hypothetical protein
MIAASQTTRQLLMKQMGPDLTKIILEMTFAKNGWDTLSSTVNQLDEWRIEAHGMPANGVLRPLPLNQSITFRLETYGVFNWVIGAVTTDSNWNLEEYLITADSHVFLTRQKFSAKGDFEVAKYPIRPLSNEDIVTVKRTNGKFIYSVEGLNETLGEVFVENSKLVTPVIGLSTNGICEIISIL